MPDTTTNAAPAELESHEPEAAEAVAPGPATEEPAAEPAEDLDDVPVEPAPAAPAPRPANEVADALRTARAAEREKVAPAKPAAPTAKPTPATKSTQESAPVLIRTTPAPAPTLGGHAGVELEGTPVVAPVMPPSSAPAPAEPPTPAAEPAQEAVPAPAEAQPAGTEGVEAPTTFESLMGILDVGARALITQHIAGLKNALSAERSTVKKLEAASKTLQVAVDEGETRRAEVATLNTDLERANALLAAEQQRAAFFEAALNEGVKRKSARLAYLAASDGGFVGADGAVRWADLREHYSDLFEAPTQAAPTRPTPRASAGAGLTTQPANGHRGLNQIIRDKAGRR